MLQAALGGLFTALLAGGCGQTAGSRRRKTVKTSGMTGLVGAFITDTYLCFRRLRRGMTAPWKSVGAEICHH